MAEPPHEGEIEFRDPEPFEAEAAGQKLSFYPAGADRRAAMIALLRSATTSLKLAFYIFAEDGVSTEVRDELVFAARRGVEVTLIIDRFGASASDEFLRPLRDAGGDHRCFGQRWSQRYLVRNHQKMIIADDTRAMFGGFNIEDDYFAPPSENGWNDLAIGIEGPAVGGLVEWYSKLEAWTGPDRPGFRAITRAVRSWDWKAGDARWLVGGPTRGLSTWAGCVTEDMRHGERLDIFMAYFSPPKKLLRDICKIAKKGSTRLLMAGKSDNNATLAASRSLYSGLLKGGAKIWEFTPCKLHTKLIVLDDVVYLGSANFDMRSLYINLELMLAVRDAALADRMRQFVTHHIEASEAITPEVQKKRATLWNRIRWKAAWVLVAVLDYTISRRLNLGL
ncbi:phosphatidylserine/phosphatidylglycerophosphate/cardiolipin synthase family protein [Qipengyuania sp.]|uniref:phospholipase D-like domain-containing protein n=1 Tax=Qipengyuania sp. TaxID=2004515 RepID=UPI0035C83ADF